MESSLAARMGLLSGGQRPFFYSVLAVLALHALLAWGLWADHALQPSPVTSQPMQVRLAAESRSGGAQAMRKVLPTQQADKAQPKVADAHIVAPKATPADARPPALAPAPQQVSLPTPVAPAQPRPAVGHEPAQPVPAPVSNQPQAVPTQANAPTAALTASGNHMATPAPAANATPTSQGGGTVARADAEATPAVKGPVDLPSASVSYLVQPVLTYPPGSEELGESGSVTLRVLVDEKGVPSKIERLKSSGYPRLDQHAASVMRRARLVPHLEQGEPRAFWVKISLEFRLN